MRQSGRTTQMLRDAVTLYRGGTPVCIIAATRAEVSRIQQMLPGGVDIPVQSMQTQSWDWFSESLHGQPHVTCFVDHYAYELHREQLSQIRLMATALENYFRTAREARSHD